MSYREAVGKALEDSMREEPRLILIGQNIAGHALRQLADTYGVDRVRDTSISESAMVGMAVGAAMKGLKVVVMIAYADIASVCHMAIVQSAAKLHYLSNDHSAADRALSRSWTRRQRGRRFMVLQRTGSEHRDAGLRQRSVLEFSRSVAAANAHLVL
jgi:pyruvate/2-oxoglutarate/acetoin dehydrogenase E1 component